MLRLKRLPFSVYLAGLVFLNIGTYLPQIGKEVGGARRWIDLGFFSFQPTEVTKYFLVVYLSASVFKKQGKAAVVFGNDCSISCYHRALYSAYDDAA